MIKFYTFVMEIGIEENFLNLTKGLYKIYGVRSRYSGYLCIKSKCVGGGTFRSNDLFRDLVAHLWLLCDNQAVQE